MNKAIVTLIILIFSVSTRAAYTSCKIDSDYINLVYFDSKHIDMNTACEEGQRVEALLRIFNSIDIKKEKLSLHLVKESDNAAYDNGSMITIPLRFYSKGYEKDSFKYYKSSESLNAIILHEYAHAIFANYLAEKWDAFYFNRQYGLEISIIKQKLLLEDNEELSSRLKKLEDELMLPRSMRDFITRLTPFQEFFADVVSVILLEDKDAIYNAIVADNHLEQRYLLRKFSDIYKSINIHNPDGHGYFYGARSLVGESYWIEALASKNSFIKKILASTVEELKLSFYMTSFLTNSAEDNKFFIETLNDGLK